MHRPETSIVFYEDYTNDVFTTLSVEEINLFYLLLEIAKTEFSGVYVKEYSIDLNKLPNNYEMIIRKLRTMIMVVNYHDGIDIISREDINLLRKTKITSEKLYFSLEKEILKPYIEHKKEFDHVFVKIDWALKSKYSKFLYRILSEHRNNIYKIHYETLLVLMNLSNPKYLAGRSYHVFNRDVLKNCVNDLNEWSDLYVEYYPIKNKNDKKSVSKITFEIKTQEPKVIEQVLSEQEEMNICVSELINEKAISEYNRVSEYTRIIDKSAYINAIINKFNRADIEAEIRLKWWLDYMKLEIKPNHNQPSVLCIDPNYKKEMITISNDYSLFDITNNKFISRKPTTTLKKINKWIEQGADFQFRALGRIYDDLLVSYVNL